MASLMNYGPQWRSRQQDTNEHVIIEHPEKDAVETVVEKMSQGFLISELRRLGNLYPDHYLLTKPKPRDLFETAYIQWAHREMTPDARKFAEDVVRIFQNHDRRERRGK